MCPDDLIMVLHRDWATGEDEHGQFVDFNGARFHIANERNDQNEQGELHYIISSRGSIHLRGNLGEAERFLEFQRKLRVPTSNSSNSSEEQSARQIPQLIVPQREFLRRMTALGYEVMWGRLSPLGGLGRDLQQGYLLTHPQVCGPHRVDLLPRRIELHTRVGRVLYTNELSRLENYLAHLAEEEG